jgi:hypothetical protein
MRIIIENAETNEFLTADGTWTKDAKHAMAYQTSEKAKERGSQVAMGRFNVVGSFSVWPQLTNLDEGIGTKPKRDK